MIKKLSQFVSVLIIVSCGNPQSNLNRGNVKSVTKIKLSIDTTGFLKECKTLMQRRSVGGLQGTNASKDSTGYLGFVQCYNCPKSYEVIFIHKGGVNKRKQMGYDGISQSFDKGCDNNFADFDCYAFVAAMRDPEKQEDMHAMNIDFPVAVKAYKRTSANNWRFIKALKAKNFKEYASLEFKTIYDLDNDK